MASVVPSEAPLTENLNVDRRRREGQRPAIQSYVNDISDSRLPQLLASRSTLPAIDPSVVRASHSQLPGSYGTSMLLSDSDHTQDSATQDLAALTRASSLTDWESVSSAMAIRQLGEGRLLDQDHDGVLVVPPLRTPRILECPFNLMYCPLTFSDSTEWIIHSLEHFGPVGPPEKNRCCFCDQQFHSDDGVRSWQDRMLHTAGHHRIGHRLAHARPDFELYTYLWQKRVINNAAYRDIKGNSEGRARHVQNYPTPPVSPQEQTSTPFTQTNSNSRRAAPAIIRNLWQSIALLSFAEGTRHPPLQTIFAILQSMCAGLAKQSLHVKGGHSGNHLRKRKFEVLFLPDPIGSLYCATLILNKFLQLQGLENSNFLTNHLLRPLFSLLFPLNSVGQAAPLNMTNQHSSPPTSLTSSPASRGSKTPLSLDLSSLPPLIAPSPPSNTLIITNLLEPSIFHPTSLAEIRSLLAHHVPLHSFSPLKSFRRIIVSFYTTDDAISVRRLLDNSPIMSSRARIYFGEPTPLEPADQHLHAPQSSRMFFISPPPSPPLGWEMHHEGPPNKEVHADDLAAALASLRAKPGADIMSSPAEEGVEGGVGGDGSTAAAAIRRKGSGGMVVYHPESHGGSPGLPAVMVEDMEESEGTSPLEAGSKLMMTHTARPPVELMHDT
ncbi:MAG: hypothetical protein Q9167_003152 [Letrouitia subvulpina]